MPSETKIRSAEPATKIVATNAKSAAPDAVRPGVARPVEQVVRRAVAA